MQSETMPNDIGRFVARYFQTLGCVSIASIIGGAIFCDGLYVDLSFVFMFWAAAYLKQHNRTARKWTIGVCSFMLAGIAIMLFVASMVGTHKMIVTFGRRIENPQFWQMAIVAGIMAVLIGLPLVLLLTPKAKREFQLSPQAP